MRTQRIGVIAVAVAGAVVLAGQPALATQPRTGVTERIEGPAGRPDANSFSPVITPDGRYVAFESFATNLVPGEEHPERRTVYVADRVTGQIEQVVRTAGGSPAGGSSPSISDDGRFVAYSSGARDIVPWVGNFLTNVYVYDRHTAATELASITHDGKEVNGASWDPVISGDGRYVAYLSYGTRIVPGQAHPGNAGNVFRYDRETGEVVKATVAVDGGEPDDRATPLAISGDGQLVTWWSQATNLVDGVNDGLAHIYAYDFTTGQVELISQSTEGEPGNLHSTGSSISGDGRYVAFDSIAFNLVPQANSGANDVYVRDRGSGTTERITVDSVGRERNRVSGQRGVISRDGRYVVYDAAASTLGALLAESYVHDRLTGATEVISVAADGSPADDSSYYPAVSNDGRHVAFYSRATNLLADEESSGTHVYVRDRGPEVGVGRAAAERTEDGIVVTGWATFSGAVVGEAILGDATWGVLLPEERSGLQLTAARAVYRPERNDLYVRLDTNGMIATPGVWDIPGEVVPAVASPPGVVYGLALAVDGVRHEIRASRGPETAPDEGFAVYRCDPLCLPVGEVEGSLGQSGNRVTVGAPLDLLGADEGSSVTDMRAFAGIGTLTTGAAVPTFELALGEGTIPQRNVTVTPAGGASTPAPLDGGRFAVTLPDPGAELSLEVSGCLGDGCGPPVTLLVPSR